MTLAPGRTDSECGVRRSMEISGGSSLFIDTNVLVYSSITTSPFYARARAALEKLWKLQCEIWISRQVLREYAATVTRPQTFASPVPPPASAFDIRRFEDQFLVC